MPTHFANSGRTLRGFPTWATVCLAFWFLLTHLGLPHFSVAEEHPNCPCGCNGANSVASGCETAPASCCQEDRGTPSTCNPSKSTTSTSCCCQKSASPQETSPQWEAICLCGQTGGHLLTLHQAFDLPPARGSLPVCGPNGSCLMLQEDYQNPPTEPATPPPRSC